MKRIIIAISIVLGLCFSLKADSISLDLKLVKLHLPFQDAAIVHLYDVINQQGLIGGETVIGEVKGLYVTGGGVTSVEGQGTGFIGGHMRLPEDLFKDKVTLGIFIARDFSDNVYRGGIKTSIPLW